MGVLIVCELPLPETSGEGQFFFAPYNYTLKFLRSCFGIVHLKCANSENLG